MIQIGAVIRGKLDKRVIIIKHHTAALKGDQALLAQLAQNAVHMNRT